MKSALHQTTTHVHPLPAIGTIHLIPVSMLQPMPCSPFKIRDDDAMQELVLSIKNFGILNPLEVRPNDSGNFEIISGARRYQGAIQNRLESIPAVILDLDDDEAIIRMVDSNIQREYLTMLLWITSKLICNRAQFCYYTPLGPQLQIIHCYYLLL